MGHAKWCLEPTTPACAEGEAGSAAERKEEATVGNLMTGSTGTSFWFIAGSSLSSRDGSSQEIHAGIPGPAALHTRTPDREDGCGGLELGTLRSPQLQSRGTKQAPKRMGAREQELKKTGRGHCCTLGVNRKIFIHKNPKLF
ncbi:hypothetical protein NDU88_006204 [Pleurodeles waltl]|uniref:Uncharacterized protein n=1 Tax=Pleurodeles waltl TaxID=8319 RepID=A0AAV7N0L6_PLEWA|nr:hypothetical protein NDU88_006204 [Pleurodeles waltl]